MTFDDLGWKLAEGAGALWLGIMTLLGREMRLSIKELEMGKADKDELTGLIQELREDRRIAREDSKAASQGRAALYAEVSKLGKSLARLEGHLGRGPAED